MALKDSDIAKKVQELKASGHALSDKEIHLILQHRARVFQKLTTNDKISSAEKIAIAMKHYSPVYITGEDGSTLMDVDKSAQACINFIEDWGMIYNPHRETIKTLPVILFPKQKDYVKWILAMISSRTNGCVDKCRDVGATWVAIFVACWLYLFNEGITVGFMTFKAEECDKMGDLGTLIPKARFFLKNLPYFFTGKEGKDWSSKQYQIECTKTHSLIRGLYGNSPGRGSRSTVVFKDESAFYADPEMVEAALDAHASVTIDISTPNGTETLFYRKKRGILERAKQQGVNGCVPLFVFDWQDNPNHTQEWFDKKRQQAEYEGTMHIFKREILRDETSSLSDRVIPTPHIRAAIDSHILFPEHFPLTGRTAGFDIANSEVDGDTNAFVVAQGHRVDYVEEWPGLDSLKASTKAWLMCSTEKIGTLVFDAIGVGATASTYFRDQQDKQVERMETHKHPSDFTYVNTEFVPFIANTPPLRPDSYEYSQDVPNKRLFRDLKAMTWWHVRNMFENTFRAVNGQPFDPNMLISVNYSDASAKQRMFFDKLLEELGQPTFTILKGRVAIDKKPKSARSPNLADAFVMCFTPIDAEFELSLLSI